MSATTDDTLDTLDTLAPPALIDSELAVSTDDVAQPVADGNKDDSEDTDTDADVDTSDVINEPRLWRDDGWTARIINNDEDDGWAVEMTRDGEREPTLIGPWTMGRDKKNPKPMDKPAFHTLVKTANEFRRRSEQQLQAQLHKSVWIDGVVGIEGVEGGTVKVTLDIIPDDDFPYAELKAWNNGELLAKVQVAANFRLNNETAERWIANDFQKPR